MSYLVANPEDRFSRGEARLYQLFNNVADDANGKFKFELQEKICLRSLRPVKAQTCLSSFRS